LSRFTEALAEALLTPGAPIADIMNTVVERVYTESEGTQRPWINSSLSGALVLRGDLAVPPQTETQVAAVQPAQDAASDELETQKLMFQAAKDSNDPADFEVYLSVFPNGIFAGMARNALERLSDTPADSGTPTAATPIISESQDGGSQPSPPVPIDQTAQPEGPLVLSATPGLISLPANSETETLLALGRDKRREIQHRLNLAGHNVGVADGVWGKKTRSGLVNWQNSQGLTPTGFLNMGQYELLVAVTQQVFDANPLSAQASSNPRGNGSGKRCYYKASKIFPGVKVRKCR
jgi:hypothetical protein